MWVIVLQRLAIELLLDIIYFPLWWYTSGAKKVLLFCIGEIKEVNITLAPGLWLKNIFVPMFGQYDIQGRIVSFFMRFINIIARSIALVFFVFLILLLFVMWLIAPVFILYMLVDSFLLFS